MPASGTLLSLQLLALAAGAAATGVWTTPHDKYSSSVGVLGCKINTNRVAYWPGSVDCNNICVKLSYGGRSVHLLRIDQSGGAYDISYDAWNYLQTGKSAASDPISGGTVAMEYQEVDASECADLIYTDGSKLPLSASNSMNFLTSCLSQPNSWVAKNHVLYNICDAICTVGFDETCTLDLATSNQPSCPHTLGLTSKLTSTPVYDISYQSGKMTVAGTGEAAPANVKAPTEPQDSGATSQSSSPQPAQTTKTPAAVFIEVTTSSTSAVAATTTSTTASSATTTSSSSSSSQTVTAVESSSSTAQATPTTLATTYNRNSTYTVGPSGSNQSTKGFSTVTSVTSSAGQSTTSGSAGSTSTVRPNAGSPGAAVPGLMLLSSLVISSVYSVLL